jgi:hypothetical protein
MQNRVFFSMQAMGNHQRYRIKSIGKAISIILRNAAAEISREFQLFAA